MGLFSKLVFAFLGLGVSQSFACEQASTIEGLAILFEQQFKYELKVDYTIIDEERNQFSTLDFMWCEADYKYEEDTCKITLLRRGSC